MEREHAALWVSVLVLALAALVGAGSTGLDWDPGPRETSTETVPDDRSSGAGELEEEPVAPEADGADRDRGWGLTVTGAFVLLGLLAAGVLAVAVLLRLRLVLRRRRTGAVRGLRAPPLAEAREVPAPDELEEVVDAGLAALGEGRPRNGVVAAWVALERSVEAAGVPRDPADTAADLVRRTLTAYQVDETALDDLAALYREARFSAHPLDEGHRDRARVCLDRLRADLRTGVRR